MALEEKKIRRALISVFHKDGLEEILKLLVDNGVELLSTGGTHSFIESLGFPCVKVEDVTGYPSILGGRVKTLHPKVMGGILSRRDEVSDKEESKKYEIPEIDLVIVDLYPFVETVKKSSDEAEIIEKIDIGGISLIRAAAKNFKDVAIVASKAQYGVIRDILKESGAVTTLEQRKSLARDAFGVSSAYDSAIFSYFDGSENPVGLRIAVDGSRSLRYGENPHQAARFFGDFDELFTQLHGKEISYNNLLDIDAAVGLISDFDGNKPTLAILKHNNACGVATRESLVDAWKAALAADPLSAFGGIIISNRPIDKETAEEMDKIFFEVAIAPSYSEEALEILRHKKNRILLEQKQTPDQLTKYRTCLNGMLAQDADAKVETADDLKVVTKLAPTESQVADLLFANKIVKNSKSNAIVLAKDGMMCASGVGQTSRVDALKHAIDKAKSFDINLEGAVMASDAFFPFPDCVEIAGKAGIKAVIHPGGSIRDNESIEWCDANGMAMVTTGYRHFKH